MNIDSINDESVLFNKCINYAMEILTEVNYNPIFLVSLYPFYFVCLHVVHFFYFIRFFIFYISFLKVELLQAQTKVQVQRNDKIHTKEGKRCHIGAY
jgi:hypothetical protein